MSYDSPDTITDGVRLKVIKTGLFYKKRALESVLLTLQQL